MHHALCFSGKSIDQGILQERGRSPDPCEQNGYQSDELLLHVWNWIHCKCSQINDFLIHNRGECIIRSINPFEGGFSPLNFEGQNVSYQDSNCWPQPAKFSSPGWNCNTSPRCHLWLNHEKTIYKFITVTCRYKVLVDWWPTAEYQRLFSCSLAESLKSLLSPLAHVTLVFGVFYRQIEISMLRCDLLQKFDKFCGGG